MDTESKFLETFMLCYCSVKAYSQQIHLTKWEMGQFGHCQIPVLSQMQCELRLSAMSLVFIIIGDIFKLVCQL
jgi:hypothetical protein